MSLGIQILLTSLVFLGLSLFMEDDSIISFVVSLIFVISLLGIFVGALLAIWSPEIEG